MRRASDWSDVASPTDFALELATVIDALRFEGIDRAHAA
jgi:hypothetical protein